MADMVTHPLEGQDADWLTSSEIVERQLGGIKRERSADSTPEEPPKLRRQNAVVGGKAEASDADDEDTDSDCEFIEIQRPIAHINPGVRAAMNLAQLRSDAKALKASMDKQIKKIKAEIEAEKIKGKPVKSKRVKLSHSRKVGITIPQQSSDKLPLQNLVDFFEKKKPDCEYLVVREQHEDGGWHIHAFFKFKSVLDIYSNQLKLKDEDGVVQTYIMNIAQVWDEAGWIKYLNKDQHEKLTNCEGGLMGCLDEAALWLMVRRRMGEIKGAIAFNQIRATWEQINKADQHVFDPCFPIESFIINESIAEWINDCRVADRGVRQPVLVVIGATKLGKTAYIRTLIHAVGETQHYFKGDWSPKALVKTPKTFLILDDLVDCKGCIDKAPPKGIAATDKWVVQGRWIQKQSIPPMYTVILANERPMWLDLPYWRANTKVVHILKPMYGARDGWCEHGNIGQCSKCNNPNRV